MSDRMRSFARQFRSVNLLSLMVIFSLFSSAFAAAQVTVSTSAVNFGNVVAGTTGAVHTVTVKNIGATPIAINSLDVSAGTPYAIAPSSTCLNPALGAGASCSVHLTMSPPALGAQPAGTLTITSTAPNSPKTVDLSGTGVNPTGLSVPAVNFGGVPVGTTSGFQTVYLYNYQLTPITVSSLSVAAPYALSGGTCQSLPGSVLPATTNCTIRVTLTPTAPGPTPATSLTVTTSAPNNPLTAALSGFGSQPTGLSVPAVNFGGVPVGTTSGFQTVYLYNYQLTPVTVSSLSVAAPYAISGGTCQSLPGSVLPATTNCTIRVTLTPTVLGPAPATSLTVTTSAPNNPLTAALSGFGSQPTGLSVSAVNFGGVPVGTTSGFQTVYLYNYQQTPVTVSSLSVAAPYAISGGTCQSLPASVLPATSNCTIQLTLSPTVLGATPATSLTVTTSAPNNPLTAALSGFGSQPTGLSVSTVNFGGVPIGTTSAPQTVYLYNYQLTPITVSPLSVAAPYAISGGTCQGLAGGILAATSNCTIQLTLSPTVLGAVPATSLSIATNASNSPLTAALSGFGSQPTGLSVTAVNFGGVPVGTTSGIKTVYLYNYQQTPITVSPLSVSAPYAISGGTCQGLAGGVLAATSNCTIQLTLSPTVPGAVPATSLSVATNASNSPLTATLSGFGSQPTGLSVSAVDFGGVPVGTTSGIKTVYLYNYQQTPITVSPLSVSAPYAISGGTCQGLAGGVLAATTNCTIQLTLTPTVPGAVPAISLSVATNASNSPLTAALSGFGSQPTGLSVTAVNFGDVLVNTTSAIRTVYLYNYQQTPITVSPLSVSAPYAISGGTCQSLAGGVLAATTNCTIQLTLTPTVLGAVPATTLSVATSATNSPLTATLSGTGVSPVAISPTGLNFGNVGVGSTSAGKTVTVKNNQSTALTIGSLTVTAGSPYSIQAASTCLTPTVAPGASCSVILTFSPVLMGAAPAAALTINDDAPNTPQTVSLTGNGVGSVALNPSSLVFGSVEITNTVVKNVTLTNYQGVPLHLTSISGFPAGFSLNTASTTCLPGTPVAAGGGTCTIAVSLTPAAAGTLGGTVSVNDDASSAPQTFAVSATATAKLVPTPASLTFPATTIGTSSTIQTITLTNPQSVGELISGASFTGVNASDFAITSTTCSTSVPLPAGASCTISAMFKPSGPGTKTATLNVGDPVIIPVVGSGTAPVTVLPGLLTYTAPVGTTSAYQTVTITNADVANTLHISKFLLSGDFVQTSTSCGTAYPYTLAAGASCSLTISFNPSIGGVRDGQLQVYDDAVTSPQVINITGTGTSPLTLSLPSLSYSAQLVGTPSNPKTLKLTNNETQSETFTLNATGDFLPSSNCASGVIAAKSSCLVYVVFKPSSVTPTTRTGTLTVPNTAPGGPVPTASLTGSAVATKPPAAVAVVSPGAGAAGTTINAIITGNGWTNFNASSVVTFVDTDDPVNNPPDITVTIPDPSTTTANTIHAQLVIASNPGVVYGARDIQVVTTLPGGPETALLSMAFIIADPNNAHTLTAISPNFGIQGQTMNVDLTATGTNFVDGLTYANFGDGITVNSLSVSSTTTAEANITISNTTPIGYRTITLVTGGEFATSGPTAFQIGPNNATLLSISPTLAPVAPTAEPQGWSGVVYLTASGTHFLQNATQVSFTGGILSPEVTVTSPTTAIVNVAVPAGAAIGLQNATVWTGGEIATLNNAFTVIGATPALLNVAPSSGTQGQTLNVVITGNAFTTFPVGGPYTHPASDPIVADFTGEIAVNSITVASASSATVNITVSPNANVGSITAKLTVSNGSGGATIFPFGFAVTPSNAAITNVVPACVPQGGQVTLAVTGAGTLWVQGNTTAAFYPVPFENISVPEVTINSLTSASLAVAVSTDTAPGTYGFYMATGGQVVSSTINVCAATPTLTMSPANGLLPSGSAVNSFSVSFTGQFTHFGPTTSAVIAGEGVTLQNFTPSGLYGATATIQIVGGTNGTPTATGLRLVTLTTGGEIVTTYFNVTQTPVGIISVSPYHAPQSTTKTVEIIGLNTSFTNSGPNPTQVLFGPQITVVPGSIVVKSTTDLTVQVTTSFMDNGSTLPTPPGWQNIYVNTGAEQVMGGFLVDSPAQPTLVSVCVTGSNPCVSSTEQASSVDVTITGSLTHWVQGTTEAILGAGVTVSNLTILSPTVATATIAVSPTAPVGGNSVIMITGSEIVGGTGFSVTPSAASIFSVGPNVTCNSELAIADFCGRSGGSGTPYVVSQLQTVVLNVVGVATHWLQGETAFSFGPGVVIDSLLVSSPTTAQVQITVLSTSPVGFAPLTTTTDGEVVTLQQAIDIEEGFPALLATSPGGAMQGATGTMQVLGRFTNWQQGVTSAAFSPAGDIKVNSVTVIDSDNLTLNVTVSPNAYVDLCAPYGHVLTVTTGTVQVIGNQPPSGVPASYFCVAQGAEQITNVSPNSYPQQTSGTVTITGSATNFIQGVSLVSFGDSGINTGTVTVNSPTSLTVPITVSTSATVGYHTVTVTTLGEIATQVYGFSVAPNVATLNEAIPNQAEQGAPIVTSPTCSTLPYCTIRLIGQYSHFSSLSTATFGAGITVQSIAYVSPTEVDAQITIDPLSYTGGRLVTVTTPGVSCAFQPAAATANVTYQGCTPGVPTGTGSEIVSNNIFTIIPGPAIIANVDPATGNEGQEIIFNITGNATHWAQNFTQFYIGGGGYDITVNSVVINSPTSATVDISISPTANPGARSIYMITNGESLTDSGAFVVTGGIPVVTYISPNSALKGTIGLGVDIYGLYTQWSSANTTINFGPGVTVASYQVDNATHIEAVLNIDPAAQVGWRTVTATTTGISGAPNGGVQILTGNFLVTAPAPPPTPYIWYESPSSGLPGQTFTITFYGAYTQWDPNPVTGTQLTGFNSDVTVNTFQVTSPTSAVANITIAPDAHASVSDVTLTTYSVIPYEVDNAQFSVVIAQPTLSVVDPSSGMQGAQNLLVNIIGQYTNFDATTTFSFGPGITTNGPPTIIGPTIATQSISIDQLSTLGYRSVVATTADVIGLGHTVSGAGFSVTPSLALILSVTPNTAKQGDTQIVEVAGQNTHWDGSTVFTLGAGIQVTKTKVNSNIDATLTIQIPSLASEGPTWITATTQGEIANLNNGFVVQAGTPLLLSSLPSSRPQQGSAVFTIVSQATSWTSAAPPAVSFGDGVVVTNVNVTSPTTLTCDGYIQPTTYTGYRNLTVTTGIQTLGLNNALYISAGPAVINSVSPATAGQGAHLPSVTITGINTNWQNGVTTLNFPNVVVNSWSVSTPTTITADLTVNDSAPAGQESISTTTLGEYASGTNVFTVTQTQPELLSVVVASQVQGWNGNVALTGRFSHFNTAPGCAPCSTVDFGTGITVNSVSAADATHITANITVQPTTTLGYRSVTVTTGAEVVTMTNSFDVTVGPAAIQGPLNPASGPQNTTGLLVHVTGSQTHFLQNTTTASFGGGIVVTNVSVIDLLHADVTINIPAGTALGFYNVSLTTNGEVATILGGFTVTPGVPIIISINPSFGHQADGDAPYLVNITGLFTHFNTVPGCSTPCSVANFGAGITVNSTTASDATHAVASITIDPAATIASRNVSVTTGTETASMAGGFSVLAGLPALLNAAPASGMAGNDYSVVVNGQFTSFTSAMPVDFGSGITVHTPLTGVTATQFTAHITIAPNASVGNRDITVTNNGQPITLPNGFAVTAGTPAITQISPPIGNPGQTNLTLTLTGQYTNWSTSSTVTIGTAADGITVVGAAGPGLPGPVVTATPTSVTLNVNIASGAPVGPAGIWVTTGGSTQIYPGGFTVQPVVIPAPSILSISPGMGSSAAPINSNIYVVFSQPMNSATFTSSNVTLRLTSNQGQGWITVPISLNLDAASRVLTIVPSSLLAVNSQYYLYLSSGITDATAAHNPINSYGQYFNTVFTAATTPPTVTAVNPLNGITGAGTNAFIQLAFSVPMNQGTDTGVTVTTAGNPVPGTLSWYANPYCCGTGWAGPGTILTFTPTAPLAASTIYTVGWGAPLTDTAGNAVTPGSFTFTTGSGADTADNNPSSDIANGQTNIGTNVAPVMFYSKPVNPLNINTSTLMLYNSDSGKYINGTVTVAPNGMSATYTPAVPLLPNTYYRLYQAGGYYDMDGNNLSNTGAYLNGINTYFTTGNGADLTAPSVAAISPMNVETAVPLNAQVIVHFNSPIDPAVVSNIVTVTPSGGSPIAGTVTLASDLVTLFFVPSNVLAPSTTYTVQLSGYQDVIGNVGAGFSSTFTTITSIAPLNVSTGINASGQAILTGNSLDPHWSFVGTAIAPSGESNFKYPGDAASDAYTGALKVVAPGNADWYSSWVANGPNSSWIAINPNSGSGNSAGFYSTAFTLSGPLPAHVCLTGYMSHDDNGLLAVNGTAIMSDQSYTGGSLTPLNIEITGNVTVGTNYLIFAFGNTDNYLEGFRLQATIQTCGASLIGGTSVNNNTASLVVTSATPSYNASGVPTNSTIKLVFNNPLDPATVNSTTLPVMVGWNSNQEIAGTYTFSSTNASNDTVTFTPDTPFPANTQIWVGACSGPYDLAGDSAAYSGCRTQITYFNTNGTATPAGSAFQVAAFTPANGATNVGLRAPVTATFNRSLNFNTINNNDYALFNGDSQSPWCDGDSYSHSQDGTSITFNCGALPSSATLTAMLNSGLQDWNGDGLASYTSQFTTTYYDYNTHGSLTTERPGNAASGVGVNQPLVLYFNLPISPSTANGGIQVAQNNVAVPGTVQVLDNGYTLEFTPSSPWAPGALIQWWTTGTLTDTVYNATFTTTNGYFYVAADTSTLTPTVQVAIPATYSNPVPRNTVFDIQFNTPLNPATVNSTNVYVFDNSNGNLHVPVTIAQPQPNEIRMTPTGTLPASHYLYVYIGAGLQSTTSVPATQTQWWEATGTTSDSTLPVVTGAVPLNGQTGIGVNVTPGVIFNKPIDSVSVNSNTFQVLNGATPLAGSYWFNSTNTRVDFVPNAPLPSNSVLTMTLNGVLDLVGNPATFSSTFTTAASPDFTAPSVVWTSASNNGTIPMNSSMTIQFNKSMDASTFNYGSNIYVRDALLGTNVTGAMSWSPSQTVLYLTPGNPLAAGREYYMYIGGGTDIAGNEMNSYSITFTATYASATTAPTIVNVNPINGATGLGTNAIVEAQFSAAIDPNYLSGVTLFGGGGTVQTTPVLSAGNTVLQLVPNMPLAANTIYTMTIAGVKDPAGNTVATFSTSFTTGPTYDIVPPVVVTVDPPSNASVGTNVTPKILFNKPLNPITVNNTTFQMFVQDTGQFIPAAIGLSANGMEVTFTPQIPLLPNTEYRFSGGWNSGPQDQDGNYYDLPWYYFYTGGGAVNSPLTVTSLSPANGAVGIPLNAAVIAHLSAPVDPTSWTQNSIQLLNGAMPVAGTVSLTNNQTLTFVPSGALSPSTIYTANVSGFTDANGNAVVPSTTSFTTGATTSAGGLGLTSSNIGWGTLNVSPTSQIILTFSQILDPATVSSSTLGVFVGWNSNRALAGALTVSGNRITFTPANPYPAGAQIWVGACYGPTDVLGEEYTTGCWAQVEYFTVAGGTPATSAFSVVSVNPTNGSVNVGRDQSVSVTFSNSINSATLCCNNLQLYSGQSLQNGGSFTISADGRTVTFNQGALSNGANYTIDIPAGGVADEWGNTLSSLFTSTFTTMSDPATGNGSVQSTVPGNTSGVPTDSLLTLFMNRQVNASTVPGSLTVTVNGQVYAGNVATVGNNYEIQYTPSAPFPNSATVQWFLSGSVMDVYGDTFNSTSGYFNTAPLPANPATATPAVSVVGPLYSGSPVPVNAQFDILYSQPIDGTTLSGNIYLYSWGTSTHVPVTYSQPSPNLVRLNPVSPLSPSTQYGICINSSVKGTNGVAATGDCWASIVTTVASSTPDTTSGTVAIGPPNGSVNVGTNAYIRLQFSKPLDGAAFYSTGSLQVMAGGNPVPGSWSLNSSNSNYVGANFYPDNPLPPSTTISVNVTGLLDYAGNTFTPVTAAFTTAAMPDFNSPNVSFDFPSSSTGIATNASFTCRYSKPIDPSSVNSSGLFIHSYGTGTSVPLNPYIFSSDLMSVTMTPTAALPANTEYYYACYNALDLTGNAQNNGSAYFYTGSGPSSTGPTLLYANPPNGMTNVPVDTSQGPWYNSSLGLLFSEPVASNSLGNITLTPSGGSPIPIGAYPEYGNTIVWITLPWELAPNTQYTYNITGVTDYNGNAMTPVTSTFTTGSSFDFTGPFVASVYPANGAASVIATTPISITFNEAMDPVLITNNQIYLQTHNTRTNVPVTLSLSTDFKTVYLAPAAPLAAGTIYDVVIYGNNWWPYDIAGNSFNTTPGYVSYNSGYVYSTFTTQ